MIPVIKKLYSALITWLFSPIPHSGIKDGVLCCIYDDNGKLINGHIIVTDGISVIIQGDNGTIYGRYASQIFYQQI